MRISASIIAHLRECHHKDQDTHTVFLSQPYFLIGSLVLDVRHSPVNRATPVSPQAVDRHPKCDEVVRMDNWGAKTIEQPTNDPDSRSRLDKRNTRQSNLEVITAPEVGVEGQRCGKVKAQTNHVAAVRLVATDARVVPPALRVHSLQPPRFRRTCCCCRCLIIFVPCLLCNLACP